LAIPSLTLKLGRQSPKTNPDSEQEDSYSNTSDYDMQDTIRESPAKFVGTCQNFWKSNSSSSDLSSELTTNSGQLNAIEAKLDKILLILDEVQKNTCTSKDILSFANTTIGKAILSKMKSNITLTVKISQSGPLFVKKS
jgi:hypothetical protein